MEPEERKMLEDLLKISQQNNRILRRMRREILVSRYIRVFYWILMLGIAYLAYIYLQPYLGQLKTYIPK